MKTRFNPEGEMTFLDHIRELRTRIIICVIALVVLSIAAYIFYEDIIQLLYHPFEKLEMPDKADHHLYVHSLLEGFQIRFKVSFLAGLILGGVYSGLRWIVRRF